MQLTARQIVVGLIVLTLLSQCSSARRYYERNAEQNERRIEARQSTQDLRIQAREAGKRSAIAIERIRAGCTPVAVGGIAQPFREGEQVTNPNGSPVPTGTPEAPVYICNAAGWTAEIVAGPGATSVMGAIAQVSPSDRQEYLSLWDLIVPTNPGQPKTTSTPAPSASPTTTPTTPTTQTTEN